MNERVVALANQAFTSANDGTIDNIKIPKEFIKKFSELIITESVQFLSDAGCEFEAEQLHEFWSEE